MKYPSYPSMKDSNVEWLGKVPSHWIVQMIKRKSRVMRGASPRPIDDPVYFDDNGEYAWVRIADVSAADTFLRETPQRLSSLGSSLSVKMQPESLFLSIAGSVGKPCITKIKCCIHDGFVYFPDLKCDVKYFFYIFAAGEAYKGLGKLGTQLNLNTETVGAIRMAFPPLPEQQAIAAFLDGKTQAIDAVIQQKERLIALLQEKRQALISQAVTKGLDPDVPMKDSGIDWLGEIPAHWAVKRLKHVTSFITSGSRGWAQHYSDDGALFLRIGNLTRDSIHLRMNDLQFVTPPDGSEGERTRVQVGDVLVSITAYIGSIAVVEDDLGDAYVNQHIALTRPRIAQAHPLWIGNSLLSDTGQAQFTRLLCGGTKDGLGLDDVANLILPIPPRDEQQAILERLNTQCLNGKRLSGTLQTQIDKLREYRQTLISAAVTGKIDVRQEVAV